MRRPRRALSLDDFQRLMEVTCKRPVAEHGRATVPLPEDKQRGRSTWSMAPLTPDNIDEAYSRGKEELDPATAAKLNAAGFERALIYKTRFLTGLRLQALAAIRIGHLQLAGSKPHIDLPAEAEKAGRGATIPLPARLAEEIRLFLQERLNQLTRAKASAGAKPSVALPANEPLFRVPKGLLRIFNRDLEAAGLPKIDESKKTACLHSLRMSFGRSCEEQCPQARKCCI